MKTLEVNVENSKKVKPNTKNLHNTICPTCNEEIIGDDYQCTYILDKQTGLMKVSIVYHKGWCYQQKNQD